jgi:hypothetical protein
MLRSAAFAAIAALASAQDCPGSPAGNYAWYKLTVTADASCADAKAELLARVSGNQEGTWKDPHDGGNGGGQYSLLEESGMVVKTSRRSDNGNYVDHQLFTLSDAGSGKCQIASCSESQGSSMGDQSTNMCNLRNLFCGSADGCCHVLTDFTWIKVSSEKSSMAGETNSVCLGGSGGSGSFSGGSKQTSCSPAPNVDDDNDEHDHDHDHDDHDDDTDSDKNKDGDKDDDSNNANKSGDADRSADTFSIVTPMLALSLCVL